MQMAYMEWLQQTDLPKLLIHADTGVIISPDSVEWYRDQLPNTETANVGPGLHYLQEIARGRSERPSRTGIGAKQADRS